jgi:small subunit ribosomal protein S17
MTGTVTSDKGDKTIVITVNVRKTHPLYRKQYSVNTKFMAHDEKNQAKVGDVVTIIETRPISARKRFALDKILERAGARFEETDATADIPEEEAAADEETKDEAKTKSKEPAKKTEAKK